MNPAAIQSRPGLRTLGLCFLRPNVGATDPSQHRPGAGLVKSARDLAQAARRGLGGYPRINPPQIVRLQPLQWNCSHPQLT
jgi:hypothetical protein